MYFATRVSDGKEAPTVKMLKNQISSFFHAPLIDIIPRMCYNFVTLYWGRTRIHKNAPEKRYCPVFIWRYRYD